MPPGRAAPGAADRVERRARSASFPFRTLRAVSRVTDTLEEVNSRCLGAEERGGAAAVRLSRAARRAAERRSARLGMRAASFRAASESPDNVMASVPNGF